MDPNTEIRKLRPAELYTLTRILAASDSWKTLMAVVPKEGTENDPKFNTEHFALIERVSCQQRKSGAEIFLEEWSTMGKQRPTLKSTLELLVRVQLFRAADYIAVDLLKSEPPERPKCGPAAPIDISDEEIAKLMQRTSPEFEIPDSQFFDSKESLDSVLDGLDYPSHLSVQNSVQYNQQESRQPAESNSHRQTQRIGLEMAQEISNLRISTGEIIQNNSNLIQFSKSEVESCETSHQDPTHHNNSNLIQFSSNSIRSTNAIGLEKNFPLANGAFNTHAGGNAQVVFQRQSITYTSSSNNADDYSSQQIIREENIRLQENDVPVGNTFDTKEFSNAGYNNGSISDSNNCNTFELQSSELPAFVADIGRNTPSMYSEVKSSELPQFVVEIAHQRSNELNTTANTESFGGPVTSNDSTSSDSSL